MSNQTARFLKSMAPYRLAILIAIFCVLWSSAFSVAKIALADCPPLIFLAIRFSLAGVVMVLAALAYGQRLPPARDLAALTLLGIINNGLYLSLSYTGLGSISAGLAALLISANPILTALAATAILGEAMTRRKAAGLALGFFGVAFVVKARLAGGVESVQGIAITLAALLTLVAGTILFKLLAPKGGLWVGSGIQNLAAGLAVAPFAFGIERLGDIALTTSLLISLLYVGLCVSIVGLLVWFYLLTVAGATAASSYHFLTPPLGIFFGWLLLGEHIALLDLLGIMPVAYGIYLVTRPAVAALSAKVVAKEPCIATGRRCS